jgi:hypothetical protein
VLEVFERRRMKGPDSLAHVVARFHGLSHVLAQGLEQITGVFSDHANGGGAHAGTLGLSPVLPVSHLDSAFGGTRN